MLKESEILLLKEKVCKEQLRAEMAEKDFQLQKRDLESQINEAQEAFHSKSTLNESALNLSNEKDSKILELEETLDNSVQEYEN